jgi:hypothetical protein
MKIVIDKKYLTVDVSDGADYVKDNVIENSGYTYLEDWILAYSDLDGNLVFITKEYLVEVMEKLGYDKEMYFDEEPTDFDDMYGNEIMVKTCNYIGNFDKWFYDLLEVIYEVLYNKWSNPWRLATANELKAMYDIDNNTKIVGFNASFYWSSTTYTNNSSFAWGVDFTSGDTYYDNKVDSLYVRCVRDRQNNTLELAPSSVEKITWVEAIEYAKNLKGIKKKYITVVKLDGLCYKKVETVKSYKVRVELEINSIDLVWVEVKANSPKKAKKLAIKEYEANPNDYKPYESDGRETRVNLKQIDDWEVKEVK